MIPMADNLNHSSVDITNEMMRRSSYQYWPFRFNIYNVVEGSVPPWRVIKFQTNKVISCAGGNME